jgi:dsRNA-specific ribonuclease
LKAVEGRLCHSKFRQKERKREKVARNVFIAVPAAVERDRFRTDARQWGLQEIPAKTQSL